MALAAGGLVVGSAGAGETPSELARTELSRRAAAVGEAQELLKKGDDAYLAGRWEEAVEAYGGALDLIPAQAPAVAEVRAAAVERFAQASVERAREQRRLGDLKGAQSTLNKVLNDGVAPDNVAALAFQEELLDPIRTEPASSKEHTANVEEVRLLLYRAQSAFNLGKFDEVGAVCEDVLRVDPTNKAARRLLERTAEAKSDYARAAYDSGRAEMLSQVDQAWELQVAPDGEIVRSGVTEVTAGVSYDYEEKLQQLVIPLVALEDVSLEEAIDFLRQRSISLDTAETDPSKRGINFVVEFGPEGSELGKFIREARITISLRNVPIGKVLETINQATRTVSRVQRFAVQIVPAGSVSDDLTIRTYQVPPDFLSAGGGATGGGDAGTDPFAEEPEQQMLPTRLTAEEVLKNRGVSFPEGASAAFNAGNSTLRVRNTEVNHAIIREIVDALASEEPVSVIVEVKVLRTQQKRLEELGFDWLLGEFSAGSFGGNPNRPGGFLSGGSQGNGDSLGDIPVPLGPFPPKPITAGNRSGDSAIRGNSIDSLITEATQGFSATDRRAPGVFAFNGMLNEAEVSMMMRGLDQKTGVDLAVVPSVVTRSGSAASVRVTREFIYPTEYEPPELPNTVGTGSFLVDLDTGEVFGEEIGFVPVTPANPTDFDMREVGVILDVLPTVDADRHYIDVTLSPNITNFDGFINYGSPILSGGGTMIAGGFGGIAQAIESEGVEVTSNRILQPVFSKLSTETALTVADNATLVFGGLLEDRVEMVEDKTPILGDIPLLGRFFQSKASQPVQTAVVFLVHVRAVDGRGKPFNP